MNCTDWRISGAPFNTDPDGLYVIGTADRDSRVWLVIGSGRVEVGRHEAGDARRIAAHLGLPEWRQISDMRRSACYRWVEVKLCFIADRPGNCYPNHEYTLVEPKDDGRR